MRIMPGIALLRWLPPYAGASDVRHCFQLVIETSACQSAMYAIPLKAKLPVYAYHYISNFSCGGNFLKRQRL